ncbi:MAG: hypothetical protein Q9174_000297 [Haloplaca sp. 1 TL-2023]
MAAATAQQRQATSTDHVLSCSICQNIPSRIYASPDEVLGLHQGEEDTKGFFITKLWLTECAHITCGKHLDGGGEIDKVHQAKGVKEGQYDNRIPAGYLQVPPPQLGQAGNEAVRFQYVSLLRFASRVHERLLDSEKELKTWKDREGSIVACLASMEPLSRALQVARDQLSRMREDVSFIDDALQFTATLNTSELGRPESLSSQSKLDGNWTPSLAVDPAGSLLAQGSAADLKIVQGGALCLADQDSIRLAQPSPSANNRALKRKVSQVITTEPHRTLGQSRFPSRGLQQRLPSRHVMPPPPGPVSNNGFADTPGRSPTSDNHFNRQSRTLGSKQNVQHSRLYENEYGSLNTSAPLTERPYTNKGSSRKHETTTPASGRFLLSRPSDDGELDQNASSSITLRGSGPPSTSPTKRLTLPQRIPSIVNRATPRRQAGISANVRTSRPQFSMPEPNRLLQAQPGNRNPGRDTPPAASPYFTILQDTPASCEPNAGTISNNTKENAMANLVPLAK